MHVTFDPRTLVHIATSSLVCNKGDYLVAGILYMQHS